VRTKTALPYDAIFGYVYAMFRINLCLTAAGLPVLLAFAFTGPQIAAWPFFVALSALCGPAATGAFAAFASMSEETDRVGRAFWAAYRAGFGRSLATAALAAAAVILLGIDLELAAGASLQVTIPVFTLLIALVIVVTTAVLAKGSALSRRGVAACAYLCVRKWYLSLANLGVLGVLLTVVTAKPALGLALLLAPALYVVWANTRHVIAPLQASGFGPGAGTHPQEG
jgi:hypothetical protein